jgi:hypothetical protein
VPGGGRTGRRDRPNRYKLLFDWPAEDALLDRIVCGLADIATVALLRPVLCVGRVAAVALRRGPGGAGVRAVASREVASICEGVLCFLPPALERER